MKLLFVSLSILFLIGCSKTNIKTYACIAHTRLNDNSGIDSIVSHANLSKYDMLLLGGDIANLSSYNDSVLMCLDSIFDVSSATTLWALGNHDYTNVDLLKSYTKKETFYTYYQDNTTFVVMDTQKDSSQIINEQLKLFNQVMDTISESENLIFLSHKLIWMRNHPSLDNEIDSVSNGGIGECSYCVQNNNFYQEIYPKLVEFSNQGKQVYCIAGDVGFKVSKFEYVTKEGIQFLGTGIKANSIGNYFLEIKNNMQSHQLSFSFKPITDL